MIFFVFIVVVDIFALITSCFVLIVVLVISVSFSIGLILIHRFWFNIHFVEFIGVVGFSALFENILTSFILTATVF